jgi:hypothetical protein
MALEAMGSDRVSVTFSVRMGARMVHVMERCCYSPHACTIIRWLPLGLRGFSRCIVTIPMALHTNKTGDEEGMNVRQDTRRA